MKCSNTPISFSQALDGSQLVESAQVAQSDEGSAAKKLWRVLKEESRESEAVQERSDRESVSEGKPRTDIGKRAVKHANARARNLQLKH
eukprot:CAMPEP_0171741454 /NCGR_PEP_ID=MMETSP0991-20121206/35570_1 /TAXON_ID=483369 /ORGANISM="non described non described, Strain CCMP2098" /LENGTH=88 /DNA_ID=CAMNT_0012339729 /DNA_START=526 /DNA_END=792 /DNA_ORIENTATION=+